MFYWPKRLMARVSTPLRTALRRLSFWRGRTEQVTSSPDQTTQGATDLKSWGIIHSADKCPFIVFEDCIIDSDYSGLGGKADTPQSVREMAWLAIYSDYIKLMDDGGGAARLKQVAKIHAGAAKIERVKDLCNLALQTGSPVMLECLRESGYKHVKRIEDIKKVVAEIKREETVLGMLIKNLPKEEKGVKITRSYFDDTFAAFADKEVLGVSVNKHDPYFFVPSYCALYRRMASKAEAMNKANKKTRHAR